MTEPTPLVGIDVGSEAVRVVVGVPVPDGLRVLGSGQATHAGAPKGVVAEMEAVTDAIRTAAEEAEAMASVPVERAIVGLGGPSIVGWRVNAAVIVEGADGRVARSDRDAVLERCKLFRRPADYTVLDVIPMGFAVDGQGGIREPIGLPARELQAEAYVLHTHRTHWDSVTEAVYAAGIEVEAVYFEPLAAAAAVLTPDELELGCLLIDIGLGTTEWTVFQEGAVVAAGCIPLGGRNFTNDLAAILRTPSRSAEEIKRRVGMETGRENPDAAVEAPPLGGEANRVYPAGYVTEILEARAKELLVAIHRPLVEFQLENVPRAGIVLTGAGALLDGLADMAEGILGHRARRGRPRNLQELADPVNSEAWAVACGLIRLHAERGATRRKEPENVSGRLLAWLRRTFGEIFEMGGGS